MADQDPPGPDETMNADGATPEQGAGDPAAGGPSDPAEDILRAAQEAIASLQSDVNQASGAAPDPMAGVMDGAGAIPNSAPLADDLPVSQFAMPEFDGVPREEPPKGIDLLSGVSLNVKIELGRTKMLIEDVLRLSEGAVVELDKLAGDPVDVYVNDRHVARGEVLVLNDNFCVRINEIVAPGAESEGIAG